MLCTWIKVKHADNLGFESDSPLLAGERPAAVVLSAENGRAQVRLGNGLAALWLPLREALGIETLDGQSLLVRGQVRLTARDERPRVTSMEGAQWIAVVGNAAFWSERVDRVAGLPGLCPLPLVADAGNRVTERCRSVLQARTGDEFRQRGAIDDLRSVVHDLQRPWLAMVDACPGRSRQMRMQVMHRLMRVRLRIEQGDPGGIDLAELSRIASYSPCHLVRVFHRVFGVPPHEHVIRERMRRAIDMLGSSRMAVAEVAQAVGVTNHSAFARQLRARLGFSASELRAGLHRGMPSRTAQRAGKDGAMARATNS